MQTNVLQSMLMRGANAIYEIEENILHEKAMIGLHKMQGTHKDFYEYRYKRLEKMQRELKVIVKIQRALKDEVAGNVKDVREFLDDRKMMFRSPIGTIRPNYEQD